MYRIQINVLTSGCLEATSIQGLKPSTDHSCKPAFEFPQDLRHGMMWRAGGWWTDRSLNLNVSRSSCLNK